MHLQLSLLASAPTQSGCLGVHSPSSCKGRCWECSAEGAQACLQAPARAHGLEGAGREQVVAALDDQLLQRRHHHAQQAGQAAPADALQNSQRYNQCSCLWCAYDGALRCTCSPAPCPMPYEAAGVHASHARSLLPPRSRARLKLCSRKAAVLWTSFAVSLHKVCARPYH